MNAERLDFRRLAIGSHLASMRPHSDECGKEPNAELTVITINGASMRPHSDECGKQALSVYNLIA